MDKRLLADQAVAEFGNLLTVEGLHLGAEDNSCVLVFDGDLLLNIEYDDASERLVFSLYLDELPRDNAEPLLREMMGANLYWHRTRGATLCLEENTGGVMLIYASSVLELDNGAFENIVENLLDQAEAWRKRITEHAQSGPAAAVPADAGMPQGAATMIFG
jgi:hypothetical protein